VGDAVLDRVAAEPGAAAGREQRIARIAALLVEPGPEHGDGAAGEWGDPVFAALAVAGNVRAGTEVDVGTGQAGQFRDP